MPARRELRVAVHYYNLQRANLGTEFREEAWATIQRIKEFPLAWHPLGGNIRRCQLVRFPYGIIYEPSQVEILVIAVACLHQAPGVLARSRRVKSNYTLHRTPQRCAMWLLGLTRPSAQRWGSLASLGAGERGR